MRRDTTDHGPRPGVLLILAVIVMSAGLLACQSAYEVGQYNEFAQERAESGSPASGADSDPGQGYDENEAAEPGSDGAVDREEPPRGDEPEQTPSSDEPGRSGCLRTMCLAGAISRGDSVNPDLAELCASPEVLGVIEQCDGTQCSPIWENFDHFLGGVNLERDVYPHLFEAMDTNDDGMVDGADEACDVQLIGYSWGGVNAARIADMYINDPAVSPERARVASLYVIDPFQTGSFGGHLEDFSVPAGVERFRSFRHSRVPASGDCSAGSFAGPYYGLPALRAGADTDAVDYDYSLAPEAFFPTTEELDWGFYGQELGHCSVLYVAAIALRFELRGQPFDFYPPTVPVAGE